MENMGIVEEWRALIGNPDMAKEEVTSEEEDIKSSLVFGSR